MDKLTTKQTEGMDLLHKKFKQGLKSLEIDEDDFEIFTTKDGDEKERVEFKNWITFKDIDVRSSTSNLKAVEKTINRLIEKVHTKSPNYIG